MYWDSAYKLLDSPPEKSLLTQFVCIRPPDSQTEILMCLLMLNAHRMGNNDTVMDSLWKKSLFFIVTSMYDTILAHHLLLKKEDPHSNNLSKQVNQTKVPACRDGHLGTTLFIQAPTMWGQLIPQWGGRGQTGSHMAQGQHNWNTKQVNLTRAHIELSVTSTPVCCPISSVHSSLCFAYVSSLLSIPFSNLTAWTCRVGLIF